MKKTLYIIAGIILGLAIPSRSANNDEYKWEAKLNGGLYLTTEPAWILEPSVTWNFHKYIGVGIDMEFTSQYNQPVRLTMINGNQAELERIERNVAWIMLKPSVAFRTPDVWRNSDNTYRLWFQAEPGISFACPFHNSLTFGIKEFRGNESMTVDYKTFRNTGLRWFYWNLRASVNFAIDRFIIGAGYYISDLDYYSGRRNVKLADGSKFRVPKKQLSQAIFLSVGYRF